MGLLSLLRVASMPIVQMLIITLLGAFMATDHLNLLPFDARMYLNKVSTHPFLNKLLCFGLEFPIFADYESDFSIMIWFLGFSKEFKLESEIHIKVLEILIFNPNLFPRVSECCVVLINHFITENIVNNVCVYILLFFVLNSS